MKYHALKQDFFLLLFYFCLHNPFSTLPLFTKLCSGSHKIHQIVSGSISLFKECTKICFKETLFSKVKKNINKKLIYSLTSCIRKLNQNKTETPKIKSKEKTTAADFCKSIFSVHTNCSTTKKEKKNTPQSIVIMDLKGERGNEGCH